MTASNDNRHEFGPRHFLSVWTACTTLRLGRSKALEGYVRLSSLNQFHQNQLGTIKSIDLFQTPPSIFFFSLMRKKTSSFSSLSNGSTVSFRAFLAPKTFFIFFRCVEAEFQISLFYSKCCSLRCV